jgi:hypothetical protein
MGRGDEGMKWLESQSTCTDPIATSSDVEKLNDIAESRGGTRKNEG